MNTVAQLLKRKKWLVLGTAVVLFVLLVGFLFSTHGQVLLAKPGMDRYVQDMAGGFLRHGGSQDREYHISQGYPVLNQTYDPYLHVYFAFEDGACVGYFNVTRMDTGDYTLSFSWMEEGNGRSVTDALTGEQRISVYTSEVFSPLLCYFVYCDGRFYDFGGSEERAEGIRADVEDPRYTAALRLQEIDI